MARLAEALDHPEDRDAAAAAIRGLIERIVLTPSEKWAEMDAVLHGDLGAILEWAGNGRENTKTDIPMPEMSVSVVAGGGATSVVCTSMRRRCVDGRGPAQDSSGPPIGRLSTSPVGSRRARQDGLPTGPRPSMNPRSEWLNASTCSRNEKCPASLSTTIRAWRSVAAITSNSAWPWAIVAVGSL